ncbi:MAG TPA: type IX secretion system membrane protein PorP/SprF [Luteibaculaceae bacterium]|nr:type IX secretion system membrane protein PorP/SprF [Luteibaculaceae bacterium]
MKMKRNSLFSYLLLGATLLVSGRVAAQQEPMVTQYLQNPLLLNPAYAGSNDALTAVALSRLQWVGFDGAPKTHSLSVHSPIQDRNIGLGVTIINDNIGPISQTGFFADVSYKLSLSAESNLRFGLRAGGNAFSARLGDVKTTDNNDISFSQNIGGKFLPNVGFGAYFNTTKFFAGFSVPRLLANSVNFDNTVTTKRAYLEARHIFITAGGLFPLSPSVNLKPSINFRYVGGAPLGVDINANFQYAEKIWFGLIYRVNDAVGGILQIQVNDQLKVGYSYDFNTSSLQKYNGGSHELMLSYDLIYRRSNIKSPRYF